MFLFTKDLLDYVEKNNVKFIDWRFTDLVGRWHHVSHSTHSLDPGIFSSGVPFDSSSVPGWQPIEASDMLLMPDISTAFLDPFFAQSTLVVLCNVVSPYCTSDYSRDPRHTARKAHQYMLSTTVADKCFFGPEVEFFVFDDVRFDVSSHEAHYRVRTQESHHKGHGRFSMNHGYELPLKGGYMKMPPVDSLHDVRAEMLSMLQEVGVRPLLHHHEVASSQCEVGIHHDELVVCADNVQKCKYVLRNVASSYGKSLTFMPKPVLNSNGSGMHCHQSLWKNGRNIFANDGGAGLSETCLHYIGGIIAHGRALNAFTNPSTNSYKRLVPRFEAPVWLAYSHHNRSAAVRIPYVPNDNACAKRIEARFPDALANPYLCFAAQLMAGLDGIKRKLDPVEVGGKSLYNLSDEESKHLVPVCAGLGEALDALEGDRDFLLEGGVFTDDVIDAYIKLKRAELRDLEITPHPVEFLHYYSL